MSRGGVIAGIGPDGEQHAVPVDENNRLEVVDKADGPDLRDVLLLILRELTALRLVSEAIYNDGRPDQADFRAIADSLETEEI